MRLSLSIPGAWAACFCSTFLVAASAIAQIPDLSQGVTNLRDVFNMGRPLAITAEFTSSSQTAADTFHRRLLEQGFAATLEAIEPAAEGKPRWAARGSRKEVFSPEGLDALVKNLNGGVKLPGSLKLSYAGARPVCRMMSREELAAMGVARNVDAKPEAVDEGSPSTCRYVLRPSGSASGVAASLSWKSATPEDTRPFKEDLVKEYQSNGFDFTAYGEGAVCSSNQIFLTQLTVCMGASDDSIFMVTVIRPTRTQTPSPPDDQLRVFEAFLRRKP